MNILVINAGSSSLKYQLMNPDTGDVTAKGLCERIGLDGRLTHKVPASGKKYEKDIPMPTHKEAIEAVMSILVDPEYGVIKSVDEIDAVGHRVLHGGDSGNDRTGCSVYILNQSDWLSNSGNRSSNHYRCITV